MEQLIRPLAAQTINWDEYIKQCQSALGISPTRGLDKAHIDPTSGQAFLGTLSLENDVFAAIENNCCCDTYKHIFFSFVVICSMDTYLEITNTNLRFVARPCPESRNDYFIILSGDMNEWRDAIVRLCSDKVITNTRKLFNEAYGYFEKAGLRDVWTGYSRSPAANDTFILKGRRGR